MKLKTLLITMATILPFGMSYANDAQNTNTVVDGVEAGAVDTNSTAPLTVKAATVNAATAAPSVQAVQDRQNTVMISPRTGMRYTVTNPANRKIIFQTEGLKPISVQNVGRIKATNPMISAESQQQAEQKLLDLAGLSAPAQSMPSNQVATANAPSTTPATQPVAQ